LEQSPAAITFEELIKTACDRNLQVGKYIGSIFYLDGNHKLRPILDMLRNHSNIKQVQKRPITLQYFANDANDANDATIETPQSNDFADRIEESTSQYSKNYVDGVPDPTSLASLRSLRKAFRCYHASCDFETEDEGEY
jgi:hypothetical protein